MLSVRPPGDKSLSHRALLLAPLASGISRLQGLLVARDTESTAQLLRALGAEIPELSSGEILIPGAAKLRAPESVLQCGNSGTTARLLMGLLAGLGLPARLDGDGSLRRRPMDRVVYPLQAMGADLVYAGQAGRLPLDVRIRASGSLRPLRHRLKVASAQVKSCLLLAGLTGRVRVEVEEPGRSRDHSERLLQAMGAPITFGPRAAGMGVVLDPEGWPGMLSALDLRVPGDPSAAAFLIVAAVLLGRCIRVEGVSLNPTRTGFLEVMREMGVGIQEEETEVVAGEPVGNLEVQPAELGPFKIDAERVPRLLDEIPALAILAIRASGRSRILGAAELRVKESDRLALLARNLGRLGVRCRELTDGLEIEGTRAPLQGKVETGGDHRIAMAFGVLACQEHNRIEVDDPGCVAVSYPDFWEALNRIQIWEGRTRRTEVGGPW